MSTPHSERATLERALVACKHELDKARAEHNELQIALCESDMNRMLERLEHFDD